jgi:hypothetical protein
MNGKVVPWDYDAVRKIAARAASAGSNVFEGVRAYWNAQRASCSCSSTRSIPAARALDEDGPHGGAVHARDRAPLISCGQRIREDAHFIGAFFLGNNFNTGADRRQRRLPHGGGVAGRAVNGVAACVASWRIRRHRPPG